MSQAKETGLPEGIRKARKESVEMIYRYEKAHQISEEQTELEEARAALHSAVLLYWNEMKRFASHPAVYNLWHDEEITDRGLTLEDIRNKRFAEGVRTEQYHDQERNAMKQREVREPWRLHPKQALAVHDRLDDCLHKLGADKNWIDERRDQYRVSEPDTKEDPIKDDIPKPGE
jgi:hypothetical protein